MFVTKRRKVLDLMLCRYSEFHAFAIFRQPDIYICVCVFTWSGRQLDPSKLWSKDALQVKWIEICTSFLLREVMEGRNVGKRL